SNRGPSLSESDALPTELSGIQMVRVRGFEPPASAFQVRSSGLAELHPVELAFPTGIEPACLPVRSRALVQLSYGKNWCDVWDSNPCCCAENADAWPLAERRMTGSGCRSRTCPTRRSRRVSTAVPCRSATSPQTVLGSLPWPSPPPVYGGALAR